VAQKPLRSAQSSFATRIFTKIQREGIIDQRLASFVISAIAHCVFAPVEPGATLGQSQLMPCYQLEICAMEPVPTATLHVLLLDIAVTGGPRMIPEEAMLKGTFNDV
jgi:hypothetical protein